MPKFLKWNVSIHAPAWGATYRKRLIPYSRPCFNPRSRMGSDENRDARYIKARVSIHAPAWGATGDSIFCERFKLVSIHAPAWGATVVLQGFRADKKFQSTLPHGERRSPLPWLPPRYWFQSTLPHGERHMGFGRLNTMYMFQSTLPHGERPASLPRVIIPDPFQSTLPHGERPRIRGRKQLEQDSFNPRSRMGSDATPSCAPNRHNAFQSTLPHGERPTSIFRTVNGNWFQSTLPHGERPTTRWI